MFSKTTGFLFFDLLLIIIFCFAVSTPAQDTRVLDGEDEDLAQLVQWMTGYFSSEEQASADSDYVDVRLRMVRIWQDRTDGYWLYVEQAIAIRQHKPYRQRVYHLTRLNEDTFESSVYMLPDPVHFVGKWRTPSAFSTLSPDSLQFREGCSILLKRKDANAFIGNTKGNSCASKLRGASYTTSEVIIKPDALISWDRGFDANGRQVWGTTKGGYIFKKLAKQVNSK
ncbi:MAG: hypothetical protein GTO51_05465 [Candidatus Latescibacteria bacterium]|nr:hypothetical protein [Candidatus Latescibacterota bacterium]NIO28452.1 hypothetical protein [Candidatus Latescibacterota bacterium]NIO56001.1 hypothetical protein [Candidatus Latescibacterota bacterium]NIT01965.1 hypothetical protein [Candidatus Latescibacterota bacterium]